MNRKSRKWRVSRALLLVSPVLLIAARPLPLDPDLRSAAPPGWLVEGKQEAGYEWLRFAAGMEMDIEDYRGPVITLYRMTVRVDPWVAGEELARLKAESQQITRREETEHKLSGVRWKGFTADYVSESGVLRRETYVYTGLEGSVLYLFWARGPLSGWESAAPLRRRSLETVAALLAGKKQPDGEAPGKDR